MKLLQSQEKTGTLLTVRNGYLVCPVCRAKSVMKIPPDTVGRNIAAFCRHCKTELKIDIEKGQCFESRSQ